MKCLKVEDALSYLDEVKERFSGQGAIYMDFLDVMREFKMQTIGTEVVIRRVRELFDGHPDLIIGFNNFIPQGYRMEAPVSRPNCITGCRSTAPAPGVENISPRRYSLNFKGDTGADLNGVSANNQYDSSGIHTSLQSIVSHESSAFRSANQPMLDFNSLPNNSATICGLNFPDSFNQGVRGSLCATPNLYTHTTPTTLNQQPQHSQSFNHALHYVNKIKNRFQGIPDAYKRFLDILQWYQREQRHADPVRRKQAEKQVYQDVAKLFDGQEDLLEEFAQFLPESTSMACAVTENLIGRRYSGHQGIDSVAELSVLASPAVSRLTEVVSGSLPHQRSDSNPCISPIPSSIESKKLKRIAATFPSSTVNSPGNPKKPRSATRDVSLVDLNQLATGFDVDLMHKIRSVLESDGANGGRSYQTFLQTLSLFNHNMISAVELLESTRPLFPRHIEVWRKFSEMIATITPKQDSSLPVASEQPTVSDSNSKDIKLESSSNSVAESDRSEQSPEPPNVGTNTLALSVGDTSQKRLDLDFTKMRTCGVSYRALPIGYPQIKCSGRLKCPIATEVLNDTYISFSSLTSEDSQFVSSKKNQYEENMYRVEDERYEVDMVTELNRAAMQNLTVVKRRMDRMNREDLNRFTLDDNLGGTSAILMRKAIHRVYGDKAGDVIYGLKNCPATVIPLVIQRMRQKDAEWREAIRGYQRFWEEQDAKNHLRSLDHQCALFKQRDFPVLRGKPMLSQIEAIARDDKPCPNLPDPIGTMISASLSHPALTTSTDLSTPGTIGSFLVNVNEGYKEPGAPHLSLVYPPPPDRNALLQDAASLIIHHVKRQTNTSKDDKRTMKLLIRTVVQDFFMSDRFPMSDDDDDDDEEDEDMNHKNDSEDPDEDGTDEAQLKHRIRRRPPKRSKDHSLDNGTKPAETRNPNSCSPVDGCPDQTRHFTPSNQKDADTDSENTICTGCTDPQIESCQPGFCSEETLRSAVFPREEHYSLFYANNHWYSFFRLHHLLLCRLQLFRSRSFELSTQAERDRDASPVQAAEALRLKRYGEVDPSEYYNRALNLVKDLLDGGEDVNRYEDRLRNMFGIYAYPWFTMDRLVANIVRHLHLLASGDEFSGRLTALYRSWTCSNAYMNSPCSDRIANANFGGIRGPLCTRYCRLANEAAYRAQALEILSSGQSGVTNGASNQSAQVNNTSSNSASSCYALVMLTEASALLIRMLSPVACTEVDSDLGASSYSDLRTLESSVSNADLNEIETADPGKVVSRNWIDYLSSHLTWTIGFVPRELMSRIRPVFLYRTVRHCVRSLTRRAIQKRRQQLIDTGDTQPEELLVQNAPTRLVSAPSPEKETAAEHGSNVAIDPSSSTHFENDVWEFMCHVFKSDITRRELFLGTFSSDCMHFTDRLVQKSQPRSHKLNWSVGSYGIFFRRKQSRKPTRTPCAQRWHDFHSKWLQARGDNIETDTACSCNIVNDNEPVNCNATKIRSDVSDFAVSDVDDERKSTVTESQVESSEEQLPMDCCPPVADQSHDVTQPSLPLSSTKPESADSE